MREPEGFAVLTAANDREALVRFRQHPVDVVITDVVMPTMDGLELIRTLARERPHVRIIAISGVEDRLNYLDIALGFGAMAALTKPLKAVQLVETVRQVLASAC